MVKYKAIGNFIHACIVSCPSNFHIFPLDLSCDLPGGTIVLQKYGTFFVPVLIALVVKC